MVQTVDRPLSLSYRRPADRAERAALERARDALAPDPRADLVEVGFAAALGLISLLFVGPVAILIVWAMQLLIGEAPFGGPSWQAAALVWVGAWAASGVLKVAQRRRLLARQRRALGEDLAEGDIQEESWRFVEAIAFQEAERLPLLYVLHADDGSAVAFEETRLLGRERMAGEAVFSAAPADAVLTRGARSGVLVGESYSGPTLPILEIHRLGLPKEARPCHGEALARPWKALPPWLGGR